MIGKAYLVGAGPGDPDLITAKGIKLLSRADCVLYDHLANPKLLDHAPPSAERIYVGKKRSDHAATQEQIIELMIDRARSGKTVVRLKGGDPFLFGRGGEEVEALAGAGIPFEVVPGVTAPLGIAAYTGVPLTHRDHTSVVTFVTGHDANRIDWSKVGTSETLVVYMGLQHLPQIAEAIIRNGRPPDVPAMAVRWGTRADQQTVVGPLSDLPNLVLQAHMYPPATIVIGEVVRLRENLNWFERRPLFGKQVIVTRARAQAVELNDLLSELGADVVELPVIELAPMEDYSELDDCIRQLEQYQWIIFTSVNAVDYFLMRLRASGRDIRSIRGRLCAIGPATAAALAACHLTVDLVPDDHRSEGVAASFRYLDLRSARILLPRAAEARELIPEALSGLGAHVDVVDAYRNIVPADAAERIRTYLAKGRRPDWITFTSGSTVRNFLALADRGSLEDVKVASIGPSTSEVIRKHGFEVYAEADPSTVPGLVQAILNLS